MILVYARWGVALCIGCVIFANHYSRDTLGALEKQIEEDMKISSTQYAHLNAVYFFPNIFLPLISGILSKKLGASACFLYACFIAGIGHMIFYLAFVNDRPEFLFVGRFISGCMYEVIDSVPILILAPLFTKEWGLICGLLNGFLRLGSVANFILCPYFLFIGGKYSSMVH